MRELGDKLNASTDEMVGEVTDDDKLRIRGKLGHIAANLRDRAGDIRDRAGDKINDTLDDIKHRTEKDDEI